MKRILHYFCLAAAFAGLLTGAGSCISSTNHHRGGIDPEYPDDPSRPGEGTELRDITLTAGYGEYWGQWYNDKSDSYLIYLYEGPTDSNGNFTGSAHMLTLDILLPRTGDLKLREGVYRCSDKNGETQIFIPAYDSVDENGNKVLDGSTLYVQRDTKHYNKLAITDGTVMVRALVTGRYEIDATIVADGAEYTFHYKGAINIEDKTQGGSQGGDDGFPGSDIYALKAKLLYNGEVYDGSDDYTLYLYYGEYLDNGDFKTVGSETVFEFLTKKTGEMKIVPGTYTCTDNDFTPGHLLEGLEQDGTVYPSYLYRQYDNKGNYSLELITDATLEVSGSASESRMKAYFKTKSGSYAVSYEGPVDIIDNRQAEVPKDIEMKDITKVVAMDCGQVWEGIECTDYRDWILYFYDKDASSTNEYTCVEFLTKENVKGSLPDMTLNKVVQVGNPSDFVPGVIIGGYTDDDNYAWGTWYCKGGTAHYAATKGTLSVKRSGDKYTLSFDFEDEEYDGTFKGSYTGPVEFTVDQGASGTARRSAGKAFSARRGAAAPRTAAPAGRHAVGQGRKAASAAPAPALRRSRTMPKAE